LTIERLMDRGRSLKLESSKQSLDFAAQPLVLATLLCQLAGALVRGDVRERQEDRCRSVAGRVALHGVLCVAVLPQC
jgi:hypothetical protein